jgi:hypothetical protein
MKFPILSAIFVMILFSFFSQIHRIDAQIDAPPGDQAIPPAPRISGDSLTQAG